MVAKKCQYAALGREIETRRKAMGYTQQSLAEALSGDAEDGGIHRDTVGAWERGETYPRGWTLKALKRTLNFTDQEIIALTSSNPNKVWKPPSDPVEGILQAHLSPTGDYARNLLKRGAQKQLVAEYIVDTMLLGTDGKLFLDAGTSLHWVAKALVARWRENTSFPHLQIMTHNLATWSELSVVNDNSVTCNLLGGRFNPSLNAFFGRFATAELEKFIPTTTLIGIDGISANGLYCCDEPGELPFKVALVKHPAKNKIVVADAAKVGIDEGVQFATLDDLANEGERIVVVTNTPEGHPTKGYVETKSQFERRFGDGCFIELG